MRGVISHKLSMQHAAPYCNCSHTATYCNTQQHTATHYNAQQHTATPSNTMQHTATHCNTLQHTATHCNTLQHTATNKGTYQGQGQDKKCPALSNGLFYTSLFTYVGRFYRSLLRSCTCVEYPEESASTIYVMYVSFVGSFVRLSSYM